MRHKLFAINCFSIAVLLVVVVPTNSSAENLLIDCKPKWNLFKEVNNSHWHRDITVTFTFISTIKTTDHVGKLEQLLNAHIKMAVFGNVNDYGASIIGLPIPLNYDPNFGVTVNLDFDYRNAERRIHEDTIKTRPLEEDKRNFTLSSTKIIKDKITFVIPPRQMLRVFQQSIDCIDESRTQGLVDNSKAIETEYLLFEPPKKQLNPVVALYALSKQKMLGLDHSDRIAIKNEHASELNDTELFYIEQNADDTISLMSKSNGLYVCFDGNVLAALCNESFKGRTREQFIKTCYSHWIGDLTTTDNCKVFGLLSVTFNRMLSTQLLDDGTILLKHARQENFLDNVNNYASALSFANPFKKNMQRQFYALGVVDLDVPGYLEIGEDGSISVVSEVANRDGPQKFLRRINSDETNSFLIDGKDDRFFEIDSCNRFDLIPSRGHSPTQFQLISACDKTPVVIDGRHQNFYFRDLPIVRYFVARKSNDDVEFILLEDSFHRKVTFTGRTTRMGPGNAQLLEVQLKADSNGKYRLRAMGSPSDLCIRVNEQLDTPEYFLSTDSENTLFEYEFCSYNVLSNFESVSRIFTSQFKTLFVDSYLQANDEHGSQFTLPLTTTNVATSMGLIAIGNNDLVLILILFPDQMGQIFV